VRILTVTPIERPSLRDVRLPKGLRARASRRSGRLGQLFTGLAGTASRYLSARRDGFLASLPCLAAACFTGAAWDVARPLGLAVAGVALLMLEVRFTPEDIR